jgi:ubiquinone/menaquinone biosynthesis C-methylase UbiE
MDHGPMLPRVLEPEVMDSAEEARDYDAMDHRQVNDRFVSDFLLIWPDAGHVLDVGTGTAQIPIELCRRAPGVRVVAVDAAPHMLDIGRENVRRAGLADRIAPQLCDAKRLPFPDESFDAVISNSIVHHIPRPRDVLAEMVRVVRRGGALLVRDLARPEDEPTLQRLVRQYAGDANDHQRQMFAASLHAALTVEEVRDLVSALGFPPGGVQMTSDRHWTWGAVKA